MNTCAEVRRVLARAGFVEEELRTVEAKPSYLMFSLPSFLVGVAYERVVNHFALSAAFGLASSAVFAKELEVSWEQLSSGQQISVPDTAMVIYRLSTVGAGCLL
jgi:hypothetical protein